MMNVRELSHLIGESFTDLVEVDLKLRHPEATFRVIPPHTVVTMEFRPNRLNVFVSDQNQISGFAWG